MRTRLVAVRARLSTVSRRPRVWVCEWLDRLLGGTLGLAQVDWAGGQEVFERLGLPSVQIRSEEVVRAAPDVIVLAPCGFHVESVEQEAVRTPFFQGRHELPAVRAAVWAVDASSYQSARPRLVDGVEHLARILHPEIFEHQTSDRSAHHSAARRPGAPNGIDTPSGAASFYFDPALLQLRSHFLHVEAGGEVVVQMDLVDHVSDFVALEQLILHWRIASSGQQGRQPVVVSDHLLEIWPGRPCPASGPCSAPATTDSLATPRTVPLSILDQCRIRRKGLGTDRRGDERCTRTKCNAQSTKTVRHELLLASKAVSTSRTRRVWRSVRVPTSERWGRASGRVHGTLVPWDSGPGTLSWDLAARSASGASLGLVRGGRRG